MNGRSPNPKQPSPESAGAPPRSLLWVAAVAVTALAAFGVVALLAKPGP